MKWFKHFSDASDDEELAMLIAEFGGDGYMFYWRVLETIASQMKPQNAQTSLTYSWRIWSQKLGISQQKLKKIYNFLSTKLEKCSNKVQTKSLLFLKKLEKSLKIDCPKLLSIKDNHFKNLQVAGNKLAPVEVEVEVEEDIPPIVPQRNTKAEVVGGVDEGDFLSASFSPAYSEVLDCWKDERCKAGLSTGLIGKNSKTGAMKLAGAIDRGETTLQDARKAIRNLLADPEKRETYSLAGLVNNFEIWVNRSPPESVKTTQLNQSKEVIYYSGICGECNYSVTGFEGGIATCPRCNGQIKLGKEV